MVEPGTETSARARRWKRYAAAGASPLIALVLVEIVCRAVCSPPECHRGGMAFEPELGFRLAANMELEGRDQDGPFPFRLNELGFRGPELPSPRASPLPGEERIVLVGDAMLTAIAVRRECHVSQATEQLLRTHGRAVEVYDLCCDDYGTAQELLLLRRYLDRLRPAAVVVAFSVGTDVLQNGLELAGSSEDSGGDLLRPYFVLDEGGSLRSTHVYPVRAFLREHLASFVHAERMLLDKGWLQRPSLPSESLEERVAHGAAPTEGLEVLREHPDDSPWGRAWRVTEALLLELRDMVAGRGARFLVVGIPHAYQVERSGRIEYLEFVGNVLTGRDPTAVLDWELPQRRLASFCEREGIAWLDLLPLLRSDVARSGEPAYTYEGHLDREAHAHFAAAVALWLVAGTTGASEAGPLAPVPLPPPAWLDFRSAPHPEHLAQGWLAWGEQEGVLGWSMGQSAGLYLKPSDGTLVLRGLLPSGAEVPVRVQVAIHEVGAREGVIEASGPFELRMPASIGYLGDKHIPLLLTCDKTTALPAPDSRQIGLVLSEIGFVSE